jgi:hypothetical protein
VSTFTNPVTGTENSIVGVAVGGIGTHGTSKTSTGAGGVSESGVGVHGVSKAGPGVRGDAENDVAVFGNCENGDGVKGHGRRGVVGESETFQGVFGKSRDNAGVVGESDKLHGVFGICHDPNGGGVFGHNDAGGFAAVFDGRVSQGPCETAGDHRVTGSVQVAGDHQVAGNVHVTGDVQLAGGDLAEEFAVVGDIEVEPGCVVVLADDDGVRVSDQPYDRRVAGVMSGAGNYRPGLILDRKAGADRCPLALTGKVWCKVDANYAPVELGDLLTSSPTPGHAMRATDSVRAFGAVIGKALGSLQSGQALVPVLVALQ